MLADEEVALSSKGDSKLPVRLPRIELEGANGTTITLLANDLKRRIARTALANHAAGVLWAYRHRSLRMHEGHSGARALQM